MKFKFLLLSILFLSIAMIPLIAQPIPSLKDLTEISPYILTGKVQSVETKIEKNIMINMVNTYVKVTLENVLKGEVDSHNILIKIHGGVKDSLRTWTEQYIPFEKGESVLLFLHLNADKIYEIKNQSCKLAETEVGGIKRYDCSKLKSDDFSKYGQGSYILKNTLLNRIQDFIAEGSN